MFLSPLNCLPDPVLSERAKGKFRGMTAKEKQCHLRLCRHFSRQLQIFQVFLLNIFDQDNIKIKFVTLLYLYTTQFWLVLIFDNQEVYKLLLSFYNLKCKLFCIATWMNLQAIWLIWKKLDFKCSVLEDERSLLNTWLLHNFIQDICSKMLTI